jgi:PTH1 family peptidyl-tRNA hydrolase
MKRRGPQLHPTCLIVGLGNPGGRYRGTRHNVGFDVIDKIAQAHKIKVKTTKHRALVGIGEIDGFAVALAKPMTFMNISGQSVKPLLQSYGLKPEQLLVIADDLDLPVGTVKMKPKGSSGGHNGHKSIIQLLGTDEYARMKIGIGKNGQTIDHVLGRFHPDEKPDVQRVLELSAEGAAVFAASGLQAAMNAVNSAD